MFKKNSRVSQLLKDNLSRLSNQNLIVNLISNDNDYYDDEEEYYTEEDAKDEDQLSEESKSAEKLKN